MTLQTLTDLKPDQKILLLGIGTEILQFLDWLISVVGVNPKQICIADRKNIEDLPDISLTHFWEGYLGDSYLEAFKNPDIKYIFKAPGIWSLSPELEEFRSKNGPDSVASSLVFFIEKFKSQIVGVTGTKGKSTTSSLIQHLLLNSGYDSKYCGNTTGISPYQFWTTKNQELIDNQKFVIELSSFQLQDLGYSQVCPDFAVITNYYIDHQDQHKTVTEYWNSKDQLFLNNPKTFVVATDQVLQKSSHLKNIDSKIIVDASTIETIQNLVKSTLLGGHNKSNLSQSLVLVEAIKSPNLGISEILKNIADKKDFYSNLLTTFKPLSHRIELVRTVETPDFTINFYDDGAATEPDAVVAAIKSLTENDNHFLWLQLTGVDTNPDLTSLTKTLKDKQVKLFRVDFCGAIGKRIYSQLYGQEMALQNYKPMAELAFDELDLELEKFKKFVISKKLTSKPVLQIALSPCGKSFDEFKNYLDRCNWWLEKVKSIQLHGS